MATEIPPTKIILPDLISLCNFKLEVNRHCEQASLASNRWLFSHLDDLNEKSRRSFEGLKAGSLASVGYPDAAYPQLRVCTDFINYLFHLDDISDDMDNRGAKNIANTVLNALYHPSKPYSSTRIAEMTKDYWTRLISTASPGAQQRFIEAFDFFFQAVAQQAEDRSNSMTPDRESYIALRRDTSGCKPCWALIEYANDLDIPNEVIDHPLIRGLREAANDLATWSNDVYSWNTEQSKGDTHNLVTVVMNEEKLDAQSAMDFVGAMYKRTIDRFNENCLNLPSWGPDIDRDISLYIRGLTNWIVGSLYWSFESERYFGKSGLDVEKTRIVTLLPRST